MEEIINQVFYSLHGRLSLVYAFVFLVAFMESFAFAGLVVPGALVAVSAGFLSAQGISNIWLTIAAASSGAVIADLASFYLAVFYGEKISKGRFYKKYYSYMEKGRVFFETHGGKSVFLGRFVGFARPVVPFLAGIMGMERVKFWIYAILSGILWGIAYIGSGYFFGKSWKLIDAWIGRFSILFVIIIIVGYLGRFLLNRYRWKNR